MRDMDWWWIVMSSDGAEGGNYEAMGNLHYVIPTGLGNGNGDS